MSRRMRIGGGIVAAALAVGIAGASAGEKPREVKVAKGLVVHEWGTFTTVAGGDGVALDWRPLAGPSDLPSFVYGVDRTQSGLRHGETCVTCDHNGCVCVDGVPPGPKHACKICKVGTVRMETPVLYFYAPEPVRVRVRVDFPKGEVTEWYPAARKVDGGIDWGRILVRPRRRRGVPARGRARATTTRRARPTPRRSVCAAA